MTVMPSIAPPDSPNSPHDPVTRLQGYIAENHLDATLIAPGVPMPTVPLAAAAIGVEPRHILKSLLFRDRHGGLVLAIAAGTGKINRERLGLISGLDRPKLADAATVLAVTGFPAGGVSPIGHRTPVRVIVDQRAAALDIAYGGGGAEDLLLRISPAEIIHQTGAIIADIADDDEGTA